MDKKTVWLDGIRKQVNLLQDTLTEKEYKKYKLRLLLCLAERVTEFEDLCGQCRLFQEDITALVQEAGNLTSLGSKESRKSYFKSIDKITAHLQKEHKLVSEGHYMGIGIAIGSGIGAALGAVLEKYGGGFPIGIGIGVAIGAALGAKARKEGRVICPKETSSPKSPTWNFKLWGVILGLALLAGLAAFFFLYRNGG